MPEKLALVVDKIDTVPEALRGAYVEEGGKFRLNADFEDVSGLKTKNAELIGTNKKLAERAKLLGDRTPEDVQADLEFAAKAREDKAKAEGNFTALQTQMAEKHAKELDGVKKRTVKIEGKLYDVLAKREVEAAITAAGGNAKVMLPHILPFIKVTEHDDDFTAQVVDAKGNPRIVDGQATPMTIAQLVEQFKADEVFGDNFKASDVKGGGARTEGAARAGGVVVIPCDASVQDYRRLKAEAEKRGVAYKVAES
jgi:hypothetical protein